MVAILLKPGSRCEVLSLLVDFRSSVYMWREAMLTSTVTFSLTHLLPLGTGTQLRWCWCCNHNIIGALQGLPSCDLDQGCIRCSQSIWYTHTQFLFVLGLFSTFLTLSFPACIFPLPRNAKWSEGKDIGSLVGKKQEGKAIRRPVSKHVWGQVGSFTQMRSQLRAPGNSLWLFIF